MADLISPDPTYVLPPFPGLWQPTPPANSFATFTFFPNVVPFAMLTSTQFLPPPPPTLTSARYARDFNEFLLGRLPEPLYPNDRVWQVTGTSVGLSYDDECTTLSVTYAMSPRQLANGTTESDKTLLVRLDLRTLGETNFKQSFGPQTQDGVVTR